jgi:histidine phosphotransfer protein HptB
MSVLPALLIDWAAFNQARAELGSDFVRILGYFREDGVKSLDAIEAAMRAKNAAALVRPAHTLKGESRQFGAEPLCRAPADPGRTDPGGCEAPPLVRRHTRNL